MIIIFIMIMLGLQIILLLICLHWIFVGIRLWINLSNKFIIKLDLMFLNSQGSSLECSFKYEGENKLRYYCKKVVNRLNEIR